MANNIIHKKKHQCKNCGLIFRSSSFLRHIAMCGKSKNLTIIKKCDKL